MKSNSKPRRNLPLPDDEGGTKPFTVKQLEADHPLFDRPDDLTDMEWKFVLNYVNADGRTSKKKAALDAGYSEETANRVGSILTDPKKSPHIAAAMSKLRQEMSGMYVTSFDRHMRDLERIRDMALEAGNFGAAVQAEYRRGQALGTIYIDRKEIRHGTIDSMSADEVRKKLQEIHDMYGGPPRKVIDVTPEPAVLEPPEPVPQTVQDTESKELIGELLNVERARRATVSDGQGQPAGQPDNPAGEPRGPRPAGLSGGAGAELGDAGAESGDDGQEGQAESASSSVPPEARPAGAADVDTGAAPPGIDTQAW